MTSELVLDCSATMPWIFASEATLETDRVLDAVTGGAKVWVPALWHLEVANVLLGARRRNRIDQAGIEQFLARLAVYDIEVDADTIAAAWSRTMGLADLYQLTEYDAVYLELALRKGVPLASLDRELCAAFKKAGGRLLLNPK